jgi:hypothetical protein
MEPLGVGIMDADNDDGLNTQMRKFFRLVEVSEVHSGQCSIYVTALYLLGTYPTLLCCDRSATATTCASC